MWDEIIYRFLNFNRGAIEVVEWMGNFTPHVDRRMITYPYWDERELVLIRWAPGYKACLIVNYVI